MGMKGDMFGTSNSSIEGVDKGGDDEQDEEDQTSEGVQNHPDILQWFREGHDGQRLEMRSDDYKKKVLFVGKGRKRVPGEKGEWSAERCREEGGQEGRGREGEGEKEGAVVARLDSTRFVGNWNQV